MNAVSTLDDIRPYLEGLRSTAQESIRLVDETAVT